MEIRQLKYFLKVAEKLNFSEASKELFITQSTLSQQISKLEQELDIALFERDSHNVSLTEAGEQLRLYAGRAVRAVDDCGQRMLDLRNLLTGELNVGVTFSFNAIAHETIVAFLKKYPGVKLNIYYKPMSELLTLLKERRLDIVLAFKPSKTDERIEIRPLFVNYLAAIANENHPLMKRSSIRLDELSAYPLMLPAQGLQARHLLDRLLTAHELSLSARVEINNVNQLLGLLRETGYVMVLSQSTILHERGLASVRIDCKGSAMEGCIHVLKNAYLKRSAQEFIRMLGESTSVHRFFC